MFGNTNGAVFGQRLTPPPFRVNDTPTHWPFVSKNNALRRLSPLIGGLCLVILTQVLPTAANSRNFASFMQQNGAIQISIVLAVTLALIVGYRRRVALRIDREGLFFSSGRKNWQYAWADIDRAVIQPNAVRLILKGRTEDQNRYNLIPVNLGLNGDQIENLVFYGTRNFSSMRAITTIAQGDDVKRARSMSRNITLIILGMTYAFFMISLTSITLGAAVDKSRLQKTGIATTATVTRIFTSSCGRHSCSIFADYNFVAQDPKDNREKTFGGTAEIGSDDKPLDADLVSVKATSTLPIAYDKNSPSFSKENLGNHMLTGDPWRVALEALGIIAGLFTLIFGAVAAGLVKVMKK